MLRALILADDLSGAADCGVAFTSAGLTTHVSLRGAVAEADAEVLAVDADTRHLRAESASDVVYRLVLQLAAQQDLLFFKKIDSTLRGHVGWELSAALAAYRTLHSASPLPIAVCAPAFPSIGRTTVDGLQRMHGMPLHETELWRLHGMTHASHIPEVLQAAGLKTALVSLPAIRSTPAGLAEAMRHAAANVDVLVCDAETDQDLRAIAGASMELGRKTLLVGSAGLAYQLPSAAGLGDAVSIVRKDLPRALGPLLFVIGSLSHRSMEQVQMLTSAAPVLRISVPPDILLSGEGSMAWRGYELRLGEAIGRGADVVLCPGSAFHVEMQDRPRLTASLARMSLTIRDQVDALVGAGGETARSVLQCWEVTGLRLLGEVEKGVPVSVTEGWSRQLPVITKAGDFGQPDTLLGCARFLRGEER